MSFRDCSSVKFNPLFPFFGDFLEIDLPIVPCLNADEGRAICVLWE